MVTTFRQSDPAAPFRRAQRTKVTVNGVTIAASAISREAQNHSAGSVLDAWQEAARSLVVRELLLQEAKRLGIEPEPALDEEGRRETEEAALIRQVIEREVVTPEPDETSCRRYYDNNRERFRLPEISEAAHILLAARPQDPEPLALACRVALELRAVLEAHPEAFADLAANHSACASSKEGGHLGQISSGDTTPEFEAALGQLQPGEISPPVETRYGVHLIRLDRTTGGGIMPYELVNARIADYLGERSRRQAVAQYLARLADAAEITGVELPTTFDLRVG